MEDEGNFDGGGNEGSGDTGAADRSLTQSREAQDATSETDVRKVVRAQKQAKGITTNREAEPIERDPNDRNVNHDDVKQALRESSERRRQEASMSRVAPHLHELAPYVETAHANGTTLPAAVKSWATAEQAVRDDPPGGVMGVLQQMGFNPAAVSTAMYNHFNDPATIQRNMAAMAQDTRNYPHFQALRGTMAQYAQAGYPLKQAYDLALASRANAARASSPASSRRAARGIH